MEEEEEEEEAAAVVEGIIGNKVGQRSLPATSQSSPELSQAREAIGNRGRRLPGLVTNTTINVLKGVIESIVVYRHSLKRIHASDYMCLG